MKRKFEIEKIIGLVALFIIGFLVIGCIPEEKSNDTEESSSSPQSTADSATANTLEGTWETSCMKKNESSGNSNKNTIEISESTLTSTYSNYADPNCQNLFKSIVIRSTYKVGVSFDSSDNEQAQEVDLTFEQITNTFGVQELVTTLNLTKACGINDWEVNVPKDVTDLKCGEGDTIFKKGQEIYSSFRVKDDKLYVADQTQGGGTTSAARLAKIDTTEPYLKK